MERVEAFVSRIIEGWSARLFGAKLQPVQLAKRLIRAMEAHQTISLSKTFVPNSYVVSLGPSDFAQFEQFRRSLERDLAETRRRLGRDTLYDLQSTNGTYVNGRRVAEKVLENGDKVSIGGLEIVFRSSE